MANSQQIASLWAKIGADTKELKQGLRDAETLMGQTGRQFTGIGEQMAIAFRAPTLALAAVGVAGVGAAGVLGKAAYDIGTSWESAFADVRKTVNGTAEELSAIGRELRDMATTKPIAREELAGIAAAAGQLGIKRENIVGFTAVIADLNNTTNLLGAQGATQLARFANITGMSQNNFDRLGSTVVDLGNNFATTEAEIMSMGLRLAGAGRTVGMTEPQILGLAAALSSVGIEAELGGSAVSRVLVDMANAAATGGPKLQAFGRVAGMTGEQFAKAFKEDAAGALTAFIAGLSRMQAAGDNVFAVLEQLEMDEIRVRDTLLRTASASDLLNDALARGNRAWQENTALTNEAEKRYATTASKVEMTKSKFTDLAVELFERLQPTINTTVDLFGNLADAASGATRFVDELGGTTGNLNFAITGVLPGLREYVALMAFLKGLQTHEGWGIKTPPGGWNVFPGPLRGGESGPVIRYRPGGHEVEDTLDIRAMADQREAEDAGLAWGNAFVSGAKKSYDTALQQAIDDQDAGENNDFLRKVWDEGAKKAEAASKRIANDMKTAAREAAEAWRNSVNEAASALRDLQRVISDLARTPLSGSKAFSDRQNGLQDQLDAIDYQMEVLEGKRGSRGELRKLEKQRADLAHQLELSQKEEKATLGPQRRMVADAANPTLPERSASEIIADLIRYRGAAGVVERVVEVAQTQNNNFYIQGQSPEEIVDAVMRRLTGASGTTGIRANPALGGAQ